MKLYGLINNKEASCCYCCWWWRRWRWCITCVQASQADSTRHYVTSSSSLGCGVNSRCSSWHVQRR